ncbi:MAG: LON peptidase substrate-binding domain-containing protein [Acidimicrobiaceae bacterium]|nr:LON peptidase substrate-binding domain-containing protein [Acidimicrobiaceae bacterium]
MIDAAAGDDAAATPMFALSTVLLPSEPLPLHVFEPRYVAMLDTVLADNREMGVVLIERGRETGGGEVRCEVATMARVVKEETLPDARMLLMAVGVRRIRVLEWLPDDPYPRAVTEDWPDQPAAAEASADGPPGTAGEALLELTGLVRRARSLAVSLELGFTPPAELLDDAEVDLGDDPSMASYRAAALAPVGPLDRYKVLRTPEAMARLEVARSVVADSVELLRARIELGAG